MTPLQLRAWLAAVNSPPEPHSPRWGGVVAPDEAAAGGFSLRHHQAYERLFVRATPDGQLAAMSVHGSEKELSGANPPNVSGDYAAYGPPGRLNEHHFRFRLGGGQKMRGAIISIPR